MELESDIITIITGNFMYRGQLVPHVAAQYQLWARNSVHAFQQVGTNSTSCESSRFYACFCARLVNADDIFEK